MSIDHVESGASAATAGPLAHIRVADFTGQLAGAAATRYLAAMGADVIRIEDPVRQGGWDLVRGSRPFVDDRRGPELGGGFNNHNVGKRFITIDLKSDSGREVFERLLSVSDIVTENFAAGAFKRMGYDYDALRAIKPDIIYVSNCGFGHSGPYESFKTWGPVVQAVCGLTFSTGLPNMPSAGIGYSYMDHHGGNVMAIGILSALIHRNRTGEGSWVDMACTEAGATMLGPAVLDYTVNGRKLRESGKPNSNRSSSPAMAPHGIFPCAGDDEWIAIGCRGDDDWHKLAEVIGQPWTREPRWADLPGRLADEDELERLVAAWSADKQRFALADQLQAAGIAAAAVQLPAERIDHDANTSEWGLWPEVEHSKIGSVRVDGLPIHLSRTDWSIENAAPLLGEHTDEVLHDLLGFAPDEIDDLRTQGVI